MMKTEIQIEILPFTVPGYVEERIAVKAAPTLAHSTVYQGSDPSEYQPSHRTFALRELSANDLNKLCNDFTNSVFKAAGKNQPPRQG